MAPETSPAAGETIGQRLKRLRLDQGLSQRELAAPGVSYAYISRIEAGTRQPSVKALRRLATKLGVTADFLETGSQLAPEEERELQLADLELEQRLLGDPSEVEPKLQAFLYEALAAGDVNSAQRARVALAAVAMERADWKTSATLLEASVEGEPFAPQDRYEIFSNLGRCYAASGRVQDAVALFERCIDAVRDAGDATLEARYAANLSYALTDIGDLGRAEEVVAHALERLNETHDPYMRVRLYWSMARLAHAEGRASVALINVRKAIALLQATDDTLHLARAHILASGITLSRGDADGAEDHLNRAEKLLSTPAAAEDRVEITIQRSRIATLRGDGATAVALARQAVDLNAGKSPIDEGRAFSALGDGLALTAEHVGADEAFRRGAELLEQQHQWRDATTACRSWAKMLREQGREEQALDVLERATEIGMRMTPADARSSR